MINDGEFSDLSDDDLEKISIIIHKPETMGRDEAAHFLGISLNKFYELRDKGVIPLPKKQKVFREKYYNKRELEKVQKIIESQSI